MVDGVSKYSITIHLDYLTPEDHRFMVFVSDHLNNTSTILDTPFPSIVHALDAAKEYITNAGAHPIGEGAGL
jgi:hypothetical protein